MRLGQTSVIHFVSKFLSSVLGFVASIYIARLLGADVLGLYSVAIAVVSWLGIVGTMGITGAIQKRVSEQEEPSEYAIAGVILMAVLFVALAGTIFIFRGYVNDYVGYPAAGYIVGMLAVSLGYNAVSSLLNGQHLVHVSGLFSPVKTGSRAGSQILAIFSGFGLSGLFGGYIIGYLVVISLGTFIVVRSFGHAEPPRKRHFRSIYDYAKFSWLGGLRGRAFNWVDIAVLRFFVSSSFIGYYTAAWNISQFLMIFGTSLSQTLFPEMSELSVKEDRAAVADLLDPALSYAGIILIPGLVGGGILGERILRIYGPDFTQAGVVLTVLIVATLFQAYQKQYTTTLNAVDRPDLAFRVNVVFIVANVVLNVILIYLHGWIGAAVATAGSVGSSLLLAHYYLSRVVDFEVPVAELGKQWFAAGVMGGLVLGGLQIETTYVQIGHHLLEVVLLVGFGAGVYFLVLFGLSSRFRDTVSQNLPV
jgi:O-antigen/teichoic acid export membrane protein